MDKAKEIYSKMIKDDHDRLILIADFDKMQKQINNLQQRINEAIEYIETNIEDEYKWDGLLYENKEKKELLDILKGDDTNE